MPARSCSCLQVQPGEVCLVGLHTVRSTASNVTHTLVNHNLLVCCAGCCRVARCSASLLCGMTVVACMETGAPTWCTTTWRMTQWRSMRYAWNDCRASGVADSVDPKSPSSSDCPSPWRLCPTLVLTAAVCSAGSAHVHLQLAVGRETEEVWLCVMPSSFDPVQVHPRNSGRDPFPVFLRRGPLPRENPRGRTLTGRIPKSLCYRCAVQSSPPPLPVACSAAELLIPRCVCWKLFVSGHKDHAHHLLLTHIAAVHCYAGLRTSGLVV